MCYSYCGGICYTSAPKIQLVRLSVKTDACSQKVHKFYRQNVLPNAMFDGLIKCTDEHLQQLVNTDNLLCQSEQTQILKKFIKLCKKRSTKRGTQLSLMTDVL